MAQTPPDWVTNTPSTPAIHNSPSQAGGAPTNPYTPAQAQNAGNQLLEQFLKQVVQAIVGIFVPPANPTMTGAAFAQLFNWGASTQATLTAHTSAIANLNSISAASHTTQAYVADIQDMATCPRANLVQTVIVDAGFPAPKSVDARGSRFNVGSTGGSFDVDVSLPCIFPVSTTVYYTPIVVDRVGTLGKLRWIAGADTSIFSINYYEVALCAYNPSNGNIEKVYGSGDIKGTTASTTTLAEVELDMGLSQTTTAGQVLFVAHQQVWLGFFQAPRAFAAQPYGGIGRPSTLLLDAACYSVNLGTQGIPSSVSLASLTRENTFIPWGAVSVHTS
jgi:hypothetical protein